ncbi:MAG TPA: bifunctional phosphopantothenoylcysteine decarboxylase/phosphopantothenate--cysteine ligase CoaBC [Saprospiraceae bacterium]|nr:bifunctional phosphopantothenoylcysteine decarboxylase/phosphopantothenate--cysteine ligase CoaBC [Saprospiraceae bacterium]
MMHGKKIVVAVTGSIAAYKSAILVRMLVKEGCEVQVLMTDSAKAFLTPLTFSTLSKKPVYSEIIESDQWNSHVELGIWADVLLISPATANTLAKCANGQADNLVVATYLSARCHVFFAPAMDLDMWAHPATRQNIQKLTEHGAQILPVGNGELASGLVGEGRMAEPEEIVSYLQRHFTEQHTFSGKHVMVTAGPTHEAIDPVRFIGNPSTGKMGTAIAKAFARRGARVTLILGPVSAPPPAGVDVIPVQSAAEMYEVSTRTFPGCDIAILAAAVSDYTPANPSSVKIKKEEGPATLELKRTQDIALTLGKQKKNGQIIVGFALETDHAETHAREKLTKKNFDFIVLNTLEDAGAGFGYDTNKVKFLFPGNEVHAFELKSKAAVAEDICNTVAVLMH